MPVTLAPVVAFGSRYALDHAGMSSKDIFTTLTLLILVTQPLDLLFDYVPEILAAFSCLSRIQDYLRREPAVASSGISRTLADSSTENNGEKGVESAIVLSNANFGWSTTEKPLLSSLNFSIPAGKLTVVTGPVACGKSTLIYGILGETTLSQGPFDFRLGRSHSAIRQPG